MVFLMFPSLSSSLSVGPCGKVLVPASSPDGGIFFLPSVYRCGSSQGWSRRFRFTALKNGVHWSPRLAVFGDMGADNPKALPRLRRDTQQGMFDAVLHVGEAPARVRLEAGELYAHRSSARTGWGWDGSEGLGAEGRSRG